MTLTLLFVPNQRAKRMQREIPTLTPELLAGVRKKAVRAMAEGHAVSLSAHVMFALLRAIDAADVPVPDETHQPRLL